jgi:hypothetical protein
MPEHPVIYDPVTDQTRPVTQADIDRLVHIATAAAKARSWLVAALQDVPLDMSAPHG